MPDNAMRVYGVTPVLLAIVALVGCDETNVYQPPPPPEVTVARPVERAIADSFDFTGTTRAVKRVELQPRVSGHLLEIKFKDGEIVHEGDELFIIDPAPFEVEKQAAEAQLSKARASLKLARANLERTQELFRRKVTTQQELDVQRAELDTAEADVEVAQAAIEKAQLQLSYTRINAPITGRIGQHLADVGNLIQVEQTLAVIESTGEIHAYFHVSERDLLRFMEMLRRHEISDPEKERIELYLGLSNEDGFPHAGYLDYRELGIDPSTGTVLRRGIFEDPDNVLIPGLFVRIRATPGKPVQRLLAPERALGTDQTGDFLLVVDEHNKVQRRQVQLGTVESGMRVVEKGLEPNEWIVVNGLQRARPESVVSPVDQDGKPVTIGGRGVEQTAAERQPEQSTADIASQTE